MERMCLDLLRLKPRVVPKGAGFGRMGLGAGRGGRAVIEK